MCSACQQCKQCSSTTPAWQLVYRSIKSTLPRHARHYLKTVMIVPSLTKDYHIMEPYQITMMYFELRRWYSPLHRNIRFAWRGFLDLDRITSQQYRKQEKSSVATASTATATVTMITSASESVGNGSVNEKKDASAGLVKKLQDLHVSSSTLSPQRLKINNTGLSSNINGGSSTSSSSNSKTNKHRPTSNAKIPISVTSLSKLPSNSTQKDDEFDADIDMVNSFLPNHRQPWITAAAIPHHLLLGQVGHVVRCQRAVPISLMAWYFIIQILVTGHVTRKVEHGFYTYPYGC